MNRYILYSTILHIILITIIYLGLPDIKNKDIQDITISIDLLDIGQITNIKSQKQQDETKEKDNKLSNRDVPKSSQKQENKIQDDELKDKPKEKEDKILTKNTPSNDNKEKVNVNVNEKPKEQLKEKEETKKLENKQIENKKTDKKNNEDKKNQSNELDSMLKTLEEYKEKNTDEKVKSQKTSSEQKQSASSGKYNENLPLSISEKDNIGNQIYKSWYFQAGTKDSKDMFVVLKILIDIGGNVTDIEIIDIAKYNKGSNYYKIFVDSAIRAVKKASPFTNLSADRYNAWRELELNFDPRGVIF
jgi:outer membrane biosynthesis protein TonB